MIGAIGQYGFVDAAVIFQVRLGVAIEIGHADVDGAADRRFEKARRPGLVVRVGGVLGAIIPDLSDLNGFQDSGRCCKSTGHTTVNVSPIRMVPVWMTDA